MSTVIPLDVFQSRQVSKAIRNSAPTAPAFQMDAAIKEGLRALRVVGNPHYAINRGKGLLRIRPVCGGDAA